MKTHHVRTSGETTTEKNDDHRAAARTLGRKAQGETTTATREDRSTPISEKWQKL